MGLQGPTKDARNLGSIALYGCHTPSDEAFQK